MVFLGLHLHWRELFKIVWLFLVPKSIWIIIFWINKSIWICFVVLSCQLSISIFRICLGIYGTSILKIDWFLMWSLILSGTGCHVFPNLHMVLLLQAKRTYASASEKVFFILYICVFMMYLFWSVFQYNLCTYNHKTYMYVCKISFQLQTIYLF